MNRPTSRFAYHTIKTNGLLSRRRFQVYQALYLNGGMTQGEAHAWIKKQGNKVQAQSLSPRYAELERLGVVWPSYTRPCRITGHKCIVWTVTNRLPKEDKTIPKKTWWIIGGRAFRKIANARKYRKEKQHTGRLYYAIEASN